MFKEKEFAISNVNRGYYDQFLGKFDPKSRATYKVSIGTFLSEIGTNDFAKITPARMLRYVEAKSLAQQKNSLAHLRSCMQLRTTSTVRQRRSEKRP